MIPKLAKPIELQVRNFEYLDDPLLRLRNWLCKARKMLFVACFAFGFVSLFMYSSLRGGGEWTVSDFIMVFLNCVFIPMMMAFGTHLNIELLVHFLPKQPANALFLRSFRNDPLTWRLRTAIQQGLGENFRLSGIRDPRRRRSGPIEWIAPLVFILRRASPKYMDLEAGDDWQSRLWESMRSSQMTFIDVSDMTEFVGHEICLASGCIGVARLVFIGDETRTIEEWQELTARKLPPGTAIGAIHLLIWNRDKPTTEEWNSFVAEVRTLADRIARLPPPDWQPKPDYVSQVQAHSPRFGTLTRLGIGYLLTQIIVGAIGRLEGDTQPLGIAMFGFIVATIIFIGVNLIAYVRHVGLAKQRIEGTIAIAIVAVQAFLICYLWTFRN